ncbi:MAG: type I restriction endonuclease subunit R, partial [Chitinophagaceae bacterium]
MLLTSEKTFETAIIDALVPDGGWMQGNAKTFDRDLALFPSQIFQFLRDTQDKRLNKITDIHGVETENKLLQRLAKEMDLRGSLDVLRNGFTDHGVRFDMAYFKPETSLNEQSAALYGKNILAVTRQVFYSKDNNKSLDLVLSLNGVPVATLELKNQFSGQNVQNAERQYMHDRDPRELIFQFKKRTLVHFTVDDNEVYMTTHLNRENTRYLPFNKGFNNGKGN